MSKLENIKIVVENKMKNSSFRTFVLLGVIVVLILSNWTACSGRRNDNKIYEQNQEAMKNELTVEENKNGDLQTSVEVFIGKTKDLKSYSEELAQEVKDLKNRKPEVIIQFETVYKDTLYITNNTIDTIGLDKDEYRLSWKYANEDSTRLIEGNSVFGARFDNNNILNITPKFTRITRDELSLNFTVGLVKNKKTGFEEIFVTPKNPNITVGSLEGAILNRKRKIGLNLSVYVGYGVFYGINNNSFGHGPSFGLSLSKPLIRF